jgi:hypothetical protein
MTGLRTTTAALAVLAAWPATALAQEESGDALPPVATETLQARDVYTPADFARFAPRNALDMLRQVPGFTIVSQDQGRGLGQANDNVLVNGERLSSKSEDVFAQLGRIGTNRVERIEIVDGATLGIPGLSGQVANVITQGAAISGRFEYRAVWRPRYARTSYGGGEISLSGSTPRLEWTAAYNHGTGRGGAGGGEGSVITDGFGNVLERRDVLIQFVGEFPRLSGTLKWDGPGTMVANFNANYGLSRNGLNNPEERELVTGVDVLRDLRNRNRGHSYEIGGDLDFALGPGRLKLIGLERFTHTRFWVNSIFIYENGSPSTGSRFAQDADSGERIARGEYRWDMLGGNWQVDAEAAFNRLDQVGQLFTLNAAGDWAEDPFPGGTGGVTEDRYELILNHNRTLAPGLSPQGLGDAGVDADAGPRPLAQAGAHRRPTRVQRFPRQREPEPANPERRQCAARAAAGVGSRFRGQEEPQGLGLGDAAGVRPLDRGLHRRHPGDGRRIARQHRRRRDALRRFAQRHDQPRPARLERRQDHRQRPDRGFDAERSAHSH